MRQYCPSCGESICSPSGSSEILLVADFPSREDLLQGRPLSVNTNYMTAGRILKKELERVGVSLTQFRICNLWLHEPNKAEGCFQAGFNNVLDEAKGKKAILLIGADAVEAFTIYKVSDVMGLQVDSSVLSAPIIYASPNPSLAEHRGVGEVRNAVEKFVKKLELEGLV
jgi:hypothetical protein